MIDEEKNGVKKTTKRATTEKNEVNRAAKKATTEKSEVNRAVKKAATEKKAINFLDDELEDIFMAGGKNKIDKGNIARKSVNSKREEEVMSIKKSVKSKAVEESATIKKSAKSKVTEEAIPVKKSAKSKVIDEATPVKKSAKSKIVEEATPVKKSVKAKAMGSDDTRKKIGEDVVEKKASKKIGSLKKAIVSEGDIVASKKSKDGKISNATAKKTSKENAEKTSKVAGEKASKATAEKTSKATAEKVSKATRSKIIKSDVDDEINEDSAEKIAREKAIKKIKECKNDQGLKARANEIIKQNKVATKKVTKKEDYVKELNINYIDDEIEAKFDIDGFDRELKKRKEISQYDLKSLLKKAAGSYLYILAFVIFLLFSGFAFYHLAKVKFIQITNICTFAYLAIAIYLMESAYNNDDASKTASSVEVIFMGIVSLILPYIYQIYNSKFIKSLIVIGIIFFVYYIFKGFVVFGMSKRDYYRQRDKFADSNDDSDDENDEFEVDED